MGLFNSYTKEGKGIDKKPDNRLRIVVFFDIYIRKFWNLILLNILYLLFCIPIVTIGPATAAMTKILRNYAREEHAFIWSDFWDTFKQNFWQAFGVGIINIFAYALLYFNYVMYMNMPDVDTLFRSVALAVILLSVTALTFMNYYIFVMMVTFKLTFKQLWKNAFIFAWAGFFRNLLITIINFIIVAICVIMILGQSPASLFFILFIVFLMASTCGLITNFITYPLIKKHMIDGFDPKTGERIAKS